MSFQEELARTARDTDALLDRLLPAQSGAAPRLAEAIRYATLGQGKRLRPFLVVESARLFDVARTNALRVGAALECVHCYSLVHDDLPAMDDDDMRRGKPTTHKAFDEATAILVGDALLTLAFEILSDRETHDEAAVRISLVSHLAKAAGAAGMVGGQMLDLEAKKGGFHALTQIMDMQAKKTGALFGFACEAGAILGKGDPLPLQIYAEKIGIAFQIADDLLDVESTPAKLGKATQKDRDKGKATFVDMLGVEEARRRASLLVDEAIQAISIYGPRAAILQDAARFILQRRS